MLLTTKEVCEVLGVHKNTIYRMVGRGEIPKLYYTKIGNQYRFNAEAVERHLLKKTPPCGDAF